MPITFLTVSVPVATEYIKILTNQLYPVKVDA